VGPVEFLEDVPDDAAPVAEAVAVPTRPPLVRWLFAVGAVAALVLAAVVARVSGDDPVTQPRPAPATAAPVVVHPPPAVPTLSVDPVDPGGARVVYLSGCNGCARVPNVPTGAQRAVRRVVSGATLSGAYTIISSTTGHLFSRGLLARGPAGRLIVEVSLIIEGPEYTASRVVGRVTVAEVQHAGYHVTVRSYGLSAPVGRLLRLAADPALIADE